MGAAKLPPGSSLSVDQVLVFWRDGQVRYIVKGIAANPGQFNGIAGAPTIA